MKRFASYLVLTLLLSILFHVSWLNYYPYFATSDAVEGILKRRGEPKFNSLGYGELRYAGKDLIPRDNPDTKTSLAVYDVSKNPLRVHCAIPESDNYWSVSMFAWNTDNFFVINDRAARSKEFDIILIGVGSSYRGTENELVLVSPTDKGVIIMRMIVFNREDKAELTWLSDIQKKSFVESISERPR